MYFIAIACVVNIALDYVFMGVLHLGPSGAALGTTLSQTVSVIVALTMFMKGKTGITVKKSDFKPRKETMGRLLKIGFPIAMQDGLIQVAFINSISFRCPECRSRKTGAGGSYFKICHLYCRGIWSDHCHYHPVYSRKCSEPVYQ